MKEDKILEAYEKTINDMKEKLEKAGIKDPLLGKIIKRVELKWKT